nr:MAG TPA: hypothetical protein [Caudoviricetes sp.]
MIIAFSSRVARFRSLHGWIFKFSSSRAVIYSALLLISSSLLNSHCMNCFFIDILRLLKVYREYL